MPSIDSVAPAPDGAPPKRITSIDALRGLVIFTMIFVNDIAGVSQAVVPPWMRHYHGKSGMTFVDLVCRLLLVKKKISIPAAFGSRLTRGDSVAKIMLHMVSRTFGLL